MNLVVARIDKLKTQSAVSKMAKHIARETTENYVDPDRTDLNYSLTNQKGTSAEIMSNLQERLSVVERKIRKDAVRAIQFTVSGSHDGMGKLNLTKQMHFFKDSLKVIQKAMGKENILSASVHMDERTPHMHVLATTVTKDNRLNYRSFLDGRNALIRLQDQFGVVGSKYGLERGVRGSRAKHTNLQEYNKRVEKSQEVPEKKLLESRDKYRERLTKENIKNLQAQNEELTHTNKIYADRLDDLKGLGLEFHDPADREKVAAIGKKLATVRLEEREKERIAGDKLWDEAVRSAPVKKTISHKRELDRGLGDDGMGF